MRNPEAEYINRLDRGQNPNLFRDTGDQGKAAEEVVINFLKRRFPQMEVRPASPAEDKGGPGIGSKKVIDAVAYLDRQPALGLQITTATDSAVRAKKLDELRSRPFLRLSEMRPQDPAIPRAIAFLEAAGVAAYQQDQNFEHHPRLGLQILESIIQSLRFDLTQTKNPKERERLLGLVALLDAEKQTIEANEKGKLH